MVSAERFLAILAEKDLLPKKVIAGLREQLQRSKQPVETAAIASTLIREGYLTPALVQRIMAAESESAQSPPPAEKPSQEDEELGFAPLEDEPHQKPGGFRPRQAEKPAEEPKPPAKGSAAAGPGTPPARSGSLLDEELKPLQAPGTGPATMDALLSGATVDDAGDGMGLAPLRRRRSFRQFVRDLFRRSRSDVVYVKPTDLRKARRLIGSYVVAVLLLVAGLGVFWYLAPPGADKLFGMAELEYETGGHAAAAAHFGEFMDRFPKHSRWGDARVRRGIARLRQATVEARASGDWPAAYELAREVITEVEGEKTSLSEVQEDLGVVLATIAEGLAKQAQERHDPGLIRQAQLTIRLLDLHVSDRRQPKERLGEVNTLLAAGELQIAQDRDLDEAVTAMRTAIEKGDTGRAYQIRNGLVANYPELAESPALEENLAAAGRSLQAAVKVVPRQQKAETAERPTAVLATLALVQQTKKGEIPVPNHVIYAQAGGAVYGVRAANGQVMWRRFVGESQQPRVGPPTTVGSGKAAAPLPHSKGTVPSSSNENWDIPPVVSPSVPSRFPPIWLGHEPGVDCLLVDPMHLELMRVEGSSGRLVWRQAIGEVPAAQPVPVRAGNRLLVPCGKGRLAVIDLLTGNALADVCFPQPLAVSPAVEAEQSVVFQVAESSNIYVLAAPDWACRQVYHLGHPAGSVKAAPVLSGGFLLVAVNEPGKGPPESTLHVLSVAPAGAAGGKILKLVQQVRLKGYIAASPVVHGQRVLVVSTRAGLQVLEINADRKTPLQIIARGELSDVEERTRFPLLLGRYFWIADQYLAKYEIQPERRRIAALRITEQGSVFLQPLMPIGTRLFLVRQKEGMPGALVSAIDMEKHEVLWQTHVAASLPGEPLVDQAAKRLTAVTSAGAMFQIDPGARQSAILDQPAIEVEAGKLLQPIRHLIALPGGMFAMTAGGGSKSLVLYDPKEQEKRFHWLLTPDAMACAPIALGGGLLAPCKTGRVFLLDPQTLGNLVDPYEARKSVADYGWRAPDVAGDNQAVLTDGEVTLYRFAVEGQPKTLTAARELKVANRIASPPAVLGQTAYAVDAKGKLLSFSLPQLEEGKAYDLEGTVAWGPRRVGKSVLLATDKDQLYCLGPQQDLVWKQPLPYGRLAGTPLVAGDEFILACTSGMVSRIRATTGEELGKVDAAVPLATGPVLVGERLFVGSPDGCLYEMKRP